jgi:hypothetical protein
MPRKKGGTCYLQRQGFSGPSEPVVPAGRRFPKILILREERSPRHDLGAQVKTLEEFLNRSAQDPNLWDCVEFFVTQDGF